MAQTKKSLNKKTFRDRYYSSMDYQQYYLLFGPPTPIVKPLDTPTQDIPELCLESQQQNHDQYFQYHGQVETQNCQTPNKNQHQNQNDPFSDDQDKVQPSEDNFIHSTNQTYNNSKQIQLSPKDKLIRQRPRSKSDNSEYLIFSFLEKINKMGKKKVKIQ